MVSVESSPRGRPSTDLRRPVAGPRLPGPNHRARAARGAQHFDAAGRLLRQVTLRRPLVVVFDDAHRADDASLLLLQHVVRTLTGERLVVVVVNHREGGRWPNGLRCLATPVTVTVRESIGARLDRLSPECVQLGAGMMWP